MSGFSYVCDCHNDSILRIGSGEYGSLVSPYNVSQKYRFLQIFAIFNEDGTGKSKKKVSENFKTDESDLFGAVLKFADIYSESARKGELEPCTSFNDFLKASEKGLNCGMLGLEGAGMVDTLEKLHTLYEKQVRFITLTWNFSNCIASGCAVTGTDDDRGLSDYGREFVKECGKLGIAIDISHASVKTMYDVIEYACGPVLATHSNFRDVCDHRRNLPFEVAKELSRRGGFIGLNTCLPFVRCGVMPEDYEADMLFDHIDYALDKGFGDSIGFGFDIDGIDDYAKGITFDRSIHDQYLDLSAFTQKYDEALQENIRCGNFIRFLKQHF